MNEYPNNDYRDYIEHSAKGQEWKNHKYLYKTAKGRYVYPEENSRGQRFKDSIDNWLYKSGRKKKAVLAREAFNSKRWKPLTGVSLNSSTNYSNEQQKINENLDRQDSNFSSVNKKNASKSKTRKSKTDRFYSRVSKATRAKNALASLRDRFSRAGSTSLSRPKATLHKRNVIRTVNPVGVGKRSAQYLESQRYNELNNMFTKSKRKPKSGSRRPRNVTGTYRMPDKRKSSSSRKFATRTSYSPLGRQLASRLSGKRDSDKYLDSVLGNARRASESRSYIDSVLRNAKYGDRPLKVVNRKGSGSSRKFSVGDYRYSSLGSQLARKFTGKRKTKKTMKNVYKTAKKMQGGHSRSRKF